MRRAETLCADDILRRRYQWRGFTVAMKLSIINSAFQSGSDTYDLPRFLGVPESEIWNVLSKADSWGDPHG